jgi:hypothetical protein
LPRLQKLIDSDKDRANVQFVTLNMDENPGLITPFLTEHHLTLTVLPAYAYVTDTLNVDGIPQNWIVDEQGVVRLKGTGYDNTGKWEQGVSEAIEKIKGAPAVAKAAGAADASSTSPR